MPKKKKTNHQKNLNKIQRENYLLEQKCKKILDEWCKNIPITKMQEK